MGVNRLLRISPLVRENLSVAIKSIRSNGLRSLLTILIIAVGITSLVGILTATDALKREVFTSFEKFGTTSFSVVRKYFSTEGGARARIRNNTTITYSQALAFKKNSAHDQLVSIYAGVASNVAVKHEGQSTNPTARVTAADENYLRYTNTGISHGRGITSNDVDLAAQVCVVVLLRCESKAGLFVYICMLRHSDHGTLQHTFQSDRRNQEGRRHHMLCIGRRVQ